MKSNSVIRQLTFLIAAFSVAMPMAVLGVSYFLWQGMASERRLTKEGDRKTQALFSLVAKVGKVQIAAQRLVREKDPDALEKLIAEGDSTAKEALEAIRTAEAGETEVASSFQILIQANEKSRQRLLVGDLADAILTMMNESNPSFERLLSAIDTFQASCQRNLAAASLRAAAQSAGRQRIVWAGIAILVCVLAAAGAMRLRKMTSNLRSVVEQLNEIAAQTADAAGQVSASSQTQAQGASEQAASLEETSAATEEINSTASQNKDHSRQAAESMARVRPKLDESDRALDQMVETIQGIHAASQAVSKVIKVIDGIAFQTNILALNAAVEAARAGDKASSIMPGVNNKQHHTKRAREGQG